MLPPLEVPGLLDQRGATLAKSAHRPLYRAAGLEVLLQLCVLRELQVAGSGGIARLTDFSRPSCGGGPQGHGYEHAFPKFAGARMSATLVSAAP